MGKSAPKQPTETTVTNTSIPQELMPFMERTLASAEAVSNRPYEAYPGQRLADFSSDTQQAFGLTRDNVGSYSPFYQTATNAIGSAMNGISDVMANRPTSAGLSQYQSANARDVMSQNWDQNAANQYMSPYIQSVINRAKLNMSEDYQQQKQGLDLRAAQMGAFGGSRHGVLEGMAADDYMNRVADMEAQLLNQGYTNAQGAFGADRNASIQAQGMNQQSDLTTLGRNLSALLGVQDLGARVDMAGTQADLQGLGLMGNLGNSMAGLGNQYSQLGYNDAAAMQNIGLSQEQLAQAGLDIGYTDFTNQRDYDRNNLAFMASMINGLPVGASSDVTNYQYNNPYAQALGAGLGMTGFAQNMGVTGGG